MSLIEFGIHLGLQDPSFKHTLYQDHLDKAYVNEAPSYTLKSCWRQIGMVEYDPRHARESHLKDPVIRLIHRYLSWTILYHPQPERLNEDHLRGLYFCVNREFRWNIPCAMATMFKRAQGMNGKELPGGQFVTTIAMRLGLLNPALLAEFAKPCVQKIKGEAIFISSMLIKRDEDDTRFRLYREYEGKEGMPPIIRFPGLAFGTSTRKRKGVNLEEGETSSSAIERLSRQLDAQGKYLDEIQDLIRMGIESTNERFLTILYKSPPTQNNQEHLPPLKRWVERIGSTHEESEEKKEEQEKEIKEIGRAHV